MHTAKNVLLVGGDGALKTRIEVPMRLAGIKIRTAATGAEALALHRTQPADVVVADLDLPGESAERFCQAIRADQTLRRVALVVVCGADEAASRRLAECRANALILRSQDPQASVAQIKRLLAAPLRAKYRVLARISVPDAGQARSFFCTSEDVSASGILVETEEALTVGQTLECSFYLPGRTHVAAQGRVVRETRRASGRRVGIAFVGLPRRDAAALDAFVASWSSPR